MERKNVPPGFVNKRSCSESNALFTWYDIANGIPLITAIRKEANARLPNVGKHLFQVWKKDLTIS